MSEESNILAHLTYAADNRNLWKSILFALVLFVLETLILYFFIIESLHVALFIILHLLAVASVVPFLKRAYKNNEDLRFPLLFFLTILAAGPFGLGGFLLQALLYPIFSLYSTHISIWLEGLFPRHRLTPFEKIHHRIKIGWDDFTKPTEVSSFQDLFTYGSLSQKQAVLDAITKDFDPVYSAILKLALNDPSNTIRIQAAAIVKKIHLDFEEDLTDIFTRQKLTPDDPSLLMDFAEHYDVFSTLDFLDPLTIQESQEQAFHYYQEYLKTNPTDQKSLLAIGRLLFHMGRFEEYISWCGQYQSQNQKVPAIFHTWYLEALYRLHRFDELGAAARGY